MNLPREDFGKLHIHLQLNLDETLFMCSGGVLGFVGGKKGVITTITSHMQYFQPYFYGLGPQVVLIVHGCS